MASNLVIEDNYVKCQMKHTHPLLAEYYPRPWTPSLMVQDVEDLASIQYVGALANLLGLYAKFCGLLATVHEGGALRACCGIQS